MGHADGGRGIVWPIRECYRMQSDLQLILVQFLPQGREQVRGVKGACGTACPVPNPDRTRFWCSDMPCLTFSLYKVTPLMLPPCRPTM
jgi:hypothetical protein